jgi:magnesium transporter
MITRYEQQGVMWIDVERPTVEEVEILVEELNLGPLVEQEMLTPTLKPRLDVYPSFMYVVLHFPATRDTRGTQDTHEVDMVIAKNFVITVHYESVSAILDFARTFETALLLKHEDIDLHSGHVLFELSTRLYQSVEDELDAIEDSVALIESSIFESRERQMVKPISLMTRELLNHKRIIANQEETLKKFENAGVSLFGDEFRGYVASMSALHYRVLNRAHMLMETLTELRSTNDSLLSTKQNEIMKNLTVVASVLLPLSLIASLFGMNTVNNPIAGSPYDFWIVSGIMVVVGVAITLYFAFKRWL